MYKRQLIAIASFSVFLNQKAIGSRKSFSTIGGKGSRSNPIRLGKWRPVIVVILMAFIAVAVVFPVVILLYQSFMPVSYTHLDVYKRQVHRKLSALEHNGPE